MPVNALFIHSLKEKSMMPIFLDEKEAVVLNTVNDFELALALYRKDEKKNVVTRQILKRIDEKKDIFQCMKPKEGICLIGHSQIDQWNVSALVGHNVFNVGINGISSFEYNKFILDENRLELGCDNFIVMHGTNDIVWDYDINEIVASILRTFDYIYEKQPNARIIFCGCAHVNGRLDRDNRKIDQFNRFIKKKLPETVKYLGLDFLDDEFNMLKKEYTIDGLHFSRKGYELLEENIIQMLKD